MKMPPILDACCGGRMFYFDKEDGRVLFQDIRDEEIELTKGGIDMLHAKDLMIGDWVLYHEKPYEILGIKEDDESIYRCLITGPEGFNWWIKITDFQPIPLTPEILEKNGFMKSEYYEVWKIICDDYEMRFTAWRLAVIFLEDGADKEEYSTPRPSFVHELQHALRLCGIDKEITL